MHTAKIVSRITRNLRFPGRDAILRKLYNPDTDGGDVKTIIKFLGNLRIHIDTRIFIEWEVFFK